MFLGFGTVVNFGLVLLGSSFGLWARRGIPERLRVGVMHAIGIFTLLLGVKLLVENKPETIKVFFLLVFGGGLGYLLSLEERLERLSQGFRGSGFLTASLLFTVGPLTFTGCLLEAVKGDSGLLLSKAFMDGISSTLLSATFGKGVLFSAFYVLFFQLSLTFAFYFFGNFISPQAMANTLFLGGGLMLALGLKILGLLEEAKPLNLMPSLLLSVFV
jgi:uncharacterized membrane protein YqgA involved in biofilm formation